MSSGLIRRTTGRWLLAKRAISTRATARNRPEVVLLGREVVSRSGVILADEGAQPVLSVCLATRVAPFATPPTRPDIVECLMLDLLRHQWDELRRNVHPREAVYWL